MHKSTRFFFTCLAVGGLLLAVSSLAEAADLILDKNLEAAVRDVLKKTDAKKPLTAEDLKDVYILKSRGKEITTLSGLEKCTNLASLDLSNNAVKDLKPLADLKNLQSLDLSINRIKDVTPLGKLVKLQYLKLDGNKIENIGGLKDLKKLSALYLSKNRIKSLKPLSGMAKLSSLYLDGNRIGDISPLKKLKWLSSLDLTDNFITNVTPLSGMTELRYTMLNKNRIADISPLVIMAIKDSEGDRRFAPYWNLYLAGNPLSDSSKTAHLAELKKIGVRVSMK